MRDSNEKSPWGHVEKLGKGTKANYDPDKKTITFCFNRSPQTSSELLRKERELLIKELQGLGYASRVKSNGEVVVDNIEQEDVVLVKKNHKLIIHLNNKQVGEKEKETSTTPSPWLSEEMFKGALKVPSLFLNYQNSPCLNDSIPFLDKNNQHKCVKLF